MRLHPNEYADSPKNDKCHQIANKIPVIMTFMTKHQPKRKGENSDHHFVEKRTDAFFGCISYLSKKCWRLNWRKHFKHSQIDVHDNRQEKFQSLFISEKIVVQFRWNKYFQEVSQNLIRKFNCFSIQGKINNYQKDNWKWSHCWGRQKNVATYWITGRQTLFFITWKNHNWHLSASCIIKTCLKEKTFYDTLRAFYIS